MSLLDVLPGWTIVRVVDAAWSTPCESCRARGRLLTEVRFDDGAQFELCEGCLP